MYADLIQLFKALNGGISDNFGYRLPRQLHTACGMLVNFDTWRQLGRVHLVHESVDFSSVHHIQNILASWMLG